MASMGKRGGDGDKVAGTGMWTGDMVVGTGWGRGKLWGWMGTETKYFTVSFSSPEPFEVGTQRSDGDPRRENELSPHHLEGLWSALSFSSGVCLKVFLHPDSIC